jgi:nitroimidazol reductase NimA-like FMN-containing flavoprotein (pyridoxamine 5'-phosphate oxidase superfamily)
MNMRRSDRQLSEAEACAVFSRADYAVLSMVTAEGSPYAVPVNAVLLEGCIYFHSAREGFKNVCMHADPRVCLTAVGSDVSFDAERRTTFYESAVVLGTVEELTDETQRVEALKALCLRFSPHNTRGFDTGFSSCAPETALWKVTVSSVTGKANKRSAD